MIGINTFGSAMIGRTMVLTSGDFVASMGWSGVFHFGWWLDCVGCHYESPMKEATQAF